MVTGANKELRRPGTGYLKGLQANAGILRIHYQAGRLSQPRSLTHGTQHKHSLILKGAALAGPVTPCKLGFYAPSSLGTLNPQPQPFTASGPITGHTEYTVQGSFSMAQAEQCQGRRALAGSGEETELSPRAGREVD